MTTSNRVTENWLRLMAYARSVIPYGEIGIVLESGEPITLTFAKRKIRFDKAETLPPTLPNVNEDGSQ